MTPIHGPDTPTIDFSDLRDSDMLNFLQLSYNFTQVFSFTITLNGFESDYILHIKINIYIKHIKCFPLSSITITLVAWILKISITFPLAGYRQYLSPLQFLCSVPNFSATICHPSSLQDLKLRILASNNSSTVYNQSIFENT